MKNKPVVLLIVYMLAIIAICIILLLPLEDEVGLVSSVSAVDNTVYVNDTLYSFNSVGKNRIYGRLYLFMDSDSTIIVRYAADSTQVIVDLTKVSVNSIVLNLRSNMRRHYYTVTR